MTIIDPPFLAATDEGLGKVIIGIVVVVFWIVSGIAQTLGKRQQEKKRREKMRPARRGRLTSS